MSTIARTTTRYQHDAALRTLVTTVVSFRSLESLQEDERALLRATLSSSNSIIITKETIFHPQGGGQPFDRGTIRLEGNPSIQFNVDLVRKLPNGLILHAGKRHPAEDYNASNPIFKESQSVVLSVDSHVRDYHSRLHTAGHLVGLAVRKLSDKIGFVSELKANHAPGSAFVEFEGLIDGQHKAAIQDSVDQMVLAALPVNVQWWDVQQARQKCAAMPSAVVITDTEELMRVVEIEGLGAYPCGGTHLPMTADVGKINIRRISRQKGISKVSYEVVVESME